MGDATDGLGVRACRGHFHVTCSGYDLASVNPCDEPFIAVQYKTREDAEAVVLLLRTAAARSAPPTPEENGQ